ncbi:MAG: hypothetical protein NZT92_09025 [Abditibacteriales bacterium]|nr:hypothetical protein [Abditibacteriales bacterium]MDW8365341.1 hypothetical protein [Abditibacteriales bacterium]
MLQRGDGFAALAVTGIVAGEGKTQLKNELPTREATGSVGDMKPLEETIPQVGETVVGAGN